MASVFPCRWLWIAIATAGCVGPPQGEALVELGGGLEQFEPLIDGQEVDMIEGAQGGWHLWIGVRARYMDPHGIQLTIERAPADTMRPLHTSVHRFDLQRSRSAAGYEVTGILGVLSQPECFQDREVLLRVTVEDADGRIADDARIVVPRWPEPIGVCEP